MQLSQALSGDLAFLKQEFGLDNVSDVLRECVETMMVLVSLSQGDEKVFVGLDSTVCREVIIAKLASVKARRKRSLTQGA